MLQLSRGWGIVDIANECRSAAFVYSSGRHLRGVFGERAGAGPKVKPVKVGSKAG